MVAYRDDRSFVMADIPGIIEGAADGKGLGVRFLRHIERNPVLLFMVPADADDIVAEYRTLLNELEKYNPEMLAKQRILAVSKSDLLDDELEEDMRAELKKEAPDLDPFFFSSVSHKNIDKLKDLIMSAIEDANPDTGLSKGPFAPLPPPLVK
jgi:GTP-binding protein